LCVRFWDARSHRRALGTGHHNRRPLRRRCGDRV